MSKTIATICAGNWKAYGSSAQLSQWAEQFATASDLTTVLCVPHPLLAQASVLLAGKATVGAQDIAVVEPGKHTGEITAELVHDAGAAWTLLGHSERRAQGESDSLIAGKLKRALHVGLRPVLCVGETTEQREAGKLEQVLTAQLQGSVPDGAQVEQLVIAYEPVWAIGSGVAASAADAQQACSFVRSKFAELYGSDKIPVLYGGSVAAENAANYVSEPDINGLLVGGASLDAGSFSDICSQAAVASS